MFHSISISCDNLTRSRALDSHEDSDNYETSKQKDERNNIWANISEILFSWWNSKVSPVDISRFRCLNHFNSLSIQSNLSVVCAAAKESGILRLNKSVFSMFSAECDESMSDKVWIVFTLISIIVFLFHGSNLILDFGKFAVILEFCFVFKTG